MLAPSRAPLTPPSSRSGRRTPPRPPGPGGWRRVRRVATTAAVLALIPALISLAVAMAQPSNSTLSIRFVEWLRDNGARGVVNRVENIYYSLTAPAKGGPPLKKLPKQAGAIVFAPHRPPHHYYRPPNIKPLTQPALPGEGVWHATYASGGSRPPVLITSFRSDPVDYPQVVAGVAWIDHTRTSTWLYPGLSEPGVSLPSRGPMEVPLSKRSSLVATFNSGFKVADSGGGFAQNGHTYAPMQPGIATILRYRSGRVNVIAWHGGAEVAPNVVYARQNLPLIVDHGKVNPQVNDSSQWGASLGNAALVWRSAVGIDRHGNLLYAAGPDQDLVKLAELLIHAGAVRAMEMDINTYWTSFISYRYPGAHGAANLLPTMDRSPQRYLTQDDRDFFAVYLR
jgi:hypothetical protein